MRTQSTGNTPWQKLLKIITIPAVEVILVIAVMLVSAWVVIESESSMHRRNAYPVLFGK